jgi:hypothetical protein
MSLSLEAGELEAIAAANRKPVKRRPVDLKDVRVGLKVDAMSSEDKTWVCLRLLGSQAGWGFAREGTATDMRRHLIKGAKGSGGL